MAYLCVHVCVCISLRVCVQHSKQTFPFISFSYIKIFFSVPIANAFLLFQSFSLHFLSHPFFHCFASPLLLRSNISIVFRITVSLRHKCEYKCLFKTSPEQKEFSSAQNTLAHRCTRFSIGHIYCICLYSLLSAREREKNLCLCADCAPHT